MPDRSDQPDQPDPPKGEQAAARDDFKNDDFKGDEAWLDAHLDNVLPEGATPAETEQRLASNPDLQTMVDLQNKIDGSLTRQFAAPELDQAFLARLAAGPLGGAANDAANDAADGLANGLANDAANDAGAEQPAAAHRTNATENRYATPLSVAKKRKAAADAGERRQPSPWVAVALLLVASGLFVFYSGDSIRELVMGPPGYEELPVTALYEDFVAAGFEPDWRCEDDQQFAQTFYERQGQGLLLRPLPEGVSMAGLAYREGLTRKATSMLAYAGDEPVLVLAARADKAPRGVLKPDRAAGISVFTRRLDDLLLVEVSRLDEPRLLDALYAADVPPAPTGHVPGDPLP